MTENLPDVNVGNIEYIRRKDVLKGQKTGTFANGIRLVAEPCVPVDYIESLEPADVVQVVRCRDCKHLGTFRGKFYCRHNCGVVEPKEDDFCSYGERREE